MVGIIILLERICYVHSYLFIGGSLCILLFFSENNINFVCCFAFDFHTLCVYFYHDKLNKHHDTLDWLFLLILQIFLNKS